MATSGRYLLENVVQRMNATWTRFMHRDPTITKSQVASRLAQDYPYLRDHALELSETNTKLTAELERRRTLWGDMVATIRAVDDVLSPGGQRTAEQNAALGECRRVRQLIEDSEQEWRYDILGAMRGR